MRRANRIVKPRTAAQRANAKRYSARTSALTIIPKDSGLPERSWWLDFGPDGFTRVAQWQSERMRLSQIGNQRNPIRNGDEA